MRSSKSRKGGFLGGLINQAITPFLLLGAQQTYRRKRSGGKKSRKNRRKGKGK